jgi:hypothetical protein
LTSLDGDVSVLFVRIATTAAAVAVLLTAAAGSAGSQSPSNFGIAVHTPFDDASGAVYLGAVPAGSVFVLPVSVATNKLPTDPDDTPVKLTGPRSARYAVELPSGLDLQPTAPVSGAGVQGTSTTCLTNCLADLGSDGTKLRLDAYYRLRATAPGTYTFRLRLTSTNRPDPDPTNDEDSRTITIRAASTAPRAGPAAATPAHPTAGRAYALTLPLTASGKAVTPIRVRCAATVAGKALRGTAARLRGRARCAWRIPADAHGKQLAARLTATVGGRTFTAARRERVR